MNRLIIFAGASGAGKSYLIEKVMERDPTIEPIKKLSTRSEREYEKDNYGFVDLYFNVSAENVQACEYHYKYGKHYYGIQKDEIEYHLSRGKSPLVIVRNSLAVKNLKRDFPDALTIYVQSILSGQDLQEKLIQLGRDDIEIGARTSRLENDYYDFCRHAELYDYILLNKFDDTSFLDQYEGMMEKEMLKPSNSKTVCFITDRNYPEKHHRLSSLLRKSRFNNYGLVRLSEIENSAIKAQSVVSKIRQADLTIIDICSESGVLDYYQGVLSAHNKNFFTIIKSGTKHIHARDFDILTYENFEGFEKNIEEKLEEYLIPPRPIRNASSLLPHFMDKAIEAAAKSTPEDDTKPRPFVGAILVDENFEIVAESYRGGESGNGEHAEFRLFNMIKDRTDINLKTSTLFVTLEPCTSRNHPKKPCADHVISSGVGSIYIGMLDPDVRIRGLGVQRLKAANIRVEMYPDAFERKISRLNADWISFVMNRDYQ